MASCGMNTGRDPGGGNCMADRLGSIGRRRLALRNRGSASARSCPTRLRRQATLAVRPFTPRNGMVRGDAVPSASLVDECQKVRPVERHQIAPVPRPAAHHVQPVGQGPQQPGPHLVVVLLRRLPLDPRGERPDGPGASRCSHATKLAAPAPVVGRVTPAVRTPVRATRRRPPPATVRRRSRQGSTR
jgi:hypothetical protein